MPKLVLAHEGALELTGVGPQTDINEIGLSERGHEQAMQVGHQLARLASLSISAAFTAPNKASKETAIEIIGLQSKTLTPMPFSRLAETAFGKINPDTLKTEFPKIVDLHGMIRRNLIRHDVLVVAARSPYRRYVGLLEKLSIEEMLALEVNYGQTRVYDINKHNRAIGKPQIFKPY